MKRIIGVMGEFMWCLEGVSTEYGGRTNRHLPTYSLEGVKPIQSGGVSAEYIMGVIGE